MKMNLLHKQCNHFQIKKFKKELEMNLFLMKIHLLETIRKEVRNKDRMIFLQIKSEKSQGDLKFPSVSRILTHIFFRIINARNNPAKI